MKKQEFVSRKEYEELRAVVSRYGNHIAFLMEERYSRLSGPEKGKGVVLQSQHSTMMTQTITDEREPKKSDNLLSDEFRAFLMKERAKTDHVNA